MNDQDRSRVASIWMMLFAVVGCLLVYGQEQPQSMSWFLQVHLTQILLFALIFLVGFLRMPPSPFEGKKLKLGSLLKTYADSWIELLRHKWILWIFGGWGLVHVIGILVQYPLNAHWMAQRHALLRLQGIPHIQFDWSRPLNSLLAAAHRRWFAGPSITYDVGTFAVAGVVLLIGALWLHKRLKQMASDPECATDANRLRTALLPIAIAWIVLAGALEKMTIDFHSAVMRSTLKLTFANPFSSGSVLTAPTILPAPIMTFGGRRNHFMDLLPKLEALYIIILAALVLAGLAGSLKRLKSNQPVTVDSFVRDVARYWKPLALASGLFAIVQLSLELSPYLRIPFLSYLPILPWIQFIWHFAFPLLMLVPYAVVVYGVGAWQAIRLGVRDFLSNAWDAVSFIALGLTIVSIPLMCQDILSQAVRLSSGLAPYALVTVLSAAITAITTAFVSVAIWEFYQQILPKSSRKTSVEGATEA